MSVSAQSWIVVADDANVAGLVKAARAVNEEVVAVVVGRRSIADDVAVAGVDRVLWVGGSPELPVEAYANAVAGIVAEAAPRAVIGAASDSGRALVGAVAARLCAPVFSSVSAFSSDGERVVVDRVAFGGIVERRESAGGTVVAVVAPQGEAVVGTAAPVEEVAVDPLPGVTVRERRLKESSGVDIGEAKTVVGVGRGLKAREDLAMVEDLAQALGGEVACSRPLAEGVDWVSKDRYIGISGQHIAPDLYVAAGISGQIQHMVGVRGAKVIVAVNSDAAAPVFRECDFGIVGDLYSVLPALTAAVRESRA